MHASFPRLARGDCTMSSLMIHWVERCVIKIILSLSLSACEPYIHMYVCLYAYTCVWAWSGEDEQFRAQACMYTCIHTYITRYTQLKKWNIHNIRVYAYTCKLLKPFSSSWSSHTCIHTHTHACTDAHNQRHNIRAVMCVCIYLQVAQALQLQLEFANMPLKHMCENIS